MNGTLEAVNVSDIPMPAGKVEYEDISILNNSESGGTSNEDFVMKSEQQPLVYLKLNNFYTHFIWIPVRQKSHQNQ